MQCNAISNAKATLGPQAMRFQTKRIEINYINAKQKDNKKKMQKIYYTFIV